MSRIGRHALACLIQLLGTGAWVSAAPEPIELGVATQIKKLTPSDAGGGQFGISVAVSGDTAVVGRWIDGAGSAYVFQRDAGGPDNWGQVKKLTAAGAAAGDRFGCSVSLHEDTVVVGAREVDSPSGVNSGAAYVFERNVGGADNWGHVKKLTAGDAAGADRFGTSVGLSGDTVVVGAAEDDDLAIDSGSAYVFERHAGGSNNWGQVKKLTVADGAALDQLGYSVSIDGDTLVVGANRGNAGTTQDTGSAYVFRRDAGGVNQWGPVKKLIASDAASPDQFGASVSISGNTVAVGAPNKDLSIHFVDYGFVYVFERHAGGIENWGQVQMLDHSGSTLLDKLGFSVSIDGDRIVAGAVEHDGAGSASGAAYAYERGGGGGTWSEVQKLIAADGSSLDLFGTSISISGGTFIVGVRDDADTGANSGSAYVFRFPAPVCGDGFQETPEQCDDGNTVGGDACAADCAVADTGVPGAASPDGEMLVSKAGSGSALEVTFAPACSATDHAAYWGTGPIAPSGLEWAGSACGLGTSGTASFDPGVLLPGEWVYFVLVGYDGGDEGDYGVSAAAVQRPEALGIGVCDRPMGSSTCP